MANTYGKVSGTFQEIVNAYEKSIRRLERSRRNLW